MNLGIYNLRESLSRRRGFGRVSPLDRLIEIPRIVISTLFSHSVYHCCSAISRMRDFESEIELKGNFNEVNNKLVFNNTPEAEICYSPDSDAIGSWNPFMMIVDGGGPFNKDCFAITPKPPKNGYAYATLKWDQQVYESQSGQYLTNATDAWNSQKELDLVIQWGGSAKCGLQRIKLLKAV